MVSYDWIGVSIKEKEDIFEGDGRLRLYHGAIARNNPISSLQPRFCKVNFWRERETKKNHLTSLALMLVSASHTKSSFFKTLVANCKLGRFWL
jgi:hypothetical protein